MELKFDRDGLIPAIVADAATGAVLQLAYMNAESFEISKREGRTCFFSRSRQELWRKGETSGNVQHIVSITADCDGDALLVLVRADGPACHENVPSCFHNPLFEGEEPPPFSWGGLYGLLAGRKAAPKEGSYTSYLFEKGTDKILKKIGEEAAEVLIAGAKKARGETVYEIADLAYHVLVLMADEGITPEEITAELAKRHVLDKKEKQETMR